MAGYVVATFAIIWVGLLAYLGWIALRVRGVRNEIEMVRELVGERLAGVDAAELEMPERL